MNEQVIEEVSEVNASDVIGEEVYIALNRLFEEVHPMLLAELDERIQGVMSFFVSAFFLELGFLVGVALWLTLKDSK